MKIITKNDKLLKTIYHEDPQTRKDIVYLKLLLSNIKYDYSEFCNEFNSDEYNNYKNEKFKYNEEKILKWFDDKNINFTTVNIPDLLFYQIDLNIQENQNNWKHKTDILGFKICNSNKIIIHEGHHRIYYAMKRGETTIQMKLLPTPNYLFKCWQNSPNF